MIMRKILSLFVAAIFSATMFAQTWTVVGNNATILSDTWKPALTANDMTQIGSTGHFTLEKTFSALAAATEFEFKVAKDHAWDESYPTGGANWIVKIPAGATKVLFFFDSSSKTVNGMSVCTVAGSSATLFGTTYDPANTANDMTYAGNVFTFTKTGVELAASTIEYKIVQNHAWDYDGKNASWPAANKQLTIAESGIYTITITFDPFTNEINATATKTGDATVVPEIKVHADFTRDGEDNWLTSDAFAVSTDSKTASLTKTLVRGTFPFGILKDGSWTSNTSAEYTRTSASWAVTGTSGNMSLVVDQDGDYTFTWTYATNTLAITYPTLVAAKYYLTGDSALVVDAGLNKSYQWNPDAIKATADAQVLSLKGGQDYKLKLSLDGTFNDGKVKGFSNLSGTAPDGVTTDADNNICFRLVADGNVTVTFNAAGFTIAGNFYVEPKMTVKFVPCAAWKADVAKTAAWVWQKGYDGQFTSFFTQAVAGSDTLQAIVEQRMDSIIFVRCNSALTEPKWNSVTETENVLAEMPKDSIDKTSLVFTSYRIDKGTWEVGPKYFITGDSALLKDANVDKAAWNEEAIKVTADSYTITGLKANQEYSLKVVLDGTWAGGTKGFSNLTGTVPAGITTDATDNIIFKLATAGDVTITFNATQFTIAGNFYVEPKVNLRFVACPALKESGAKTAAWVWQKGKEGYFTPFFTQVAAGSDTLQVEVEERVDSVIFVRCNSALTEPKWNSLTETENVLTEMPKDSIVKTSWTYTSVTLAVGTWDVWVPAKFYVTGDAVALGEWNPMAIKAVKDTVVLNLPAGTYQMKITLDGDWATVKGYSDLTEKAEGLWESSGGNITFALAAAGEVKVVYNASIFKLIGTFDESQVPVVLADGYYLIGQTGWTVSDLNASLKFAETATAGEYMLNVTLTTFQQIKVVALQNNVITTWYPDGVDNAYVVDNDHAGVRDIYFRPAGNSPAWDEFGGYIWMGNNGGGTDIDSNADGVKAVKVLRDGQLLIIKGEKIFNVLGTQIQ